MAKKFINADNFCFICSKCGLFERKKLVKIKNINKFICAKCIEIQKELGIIFTETKYDGKKPYIYLLDDSY